LELPAQPAPTPAWQTIHGELRRVVGESTYEIWLAALELKAWDGEVLLVQAPVATEAWVSTRFGRILETCARNILGAATRVVLASAAEAQTSEPHRSSTDAHEMRRAEAGMAGALNPRYSFEQFIIGDSNQLAHAASLAVAELPGQAYNPLFLYAPPGLGKTHLLHAIGNYVLAFGGGATIRYTTVEAFTNHFIAALGSKSLDRFKRSYRDADVLLVDDVQFLASKAKTEEEFFYTFNALYENGRQLVLTCDRLPRQLVAVEERLRERFESGLVADIRPPDHATRVTILRKRAALDRIAVADSAVFDLIADRVTSNVRTLEGALIRVVAHHSLTRRPIDVQLASAVLDSIDPTTSPRPTSIETIRATVAAHYQLSVDELVSSSRTARIAWPRQIAIHLTRELTDASLHAIGEAFGGRNHATVLHACKRVCARLAGEQEAASEIAELSALILRRQADRDY
jgi:chromosomal replication initiator protein